MIKQKFTHIETLRGFAILLVVMGHVIGSTPTGGMKIDFPSPWRYLYLWIDYIQMPLFTAIAGWVYALKPVTNGNFNPFLLKKVYRLLIPMITVGTLYFLIQYITPGTNTKGHFADIWRIYIFPYTIYWYLPSLFLIFLFMAYIDKQHYAEKFAQWKWVLAISLLGMISQISFIPNFIPNLFSFKGALLQLPYFVIGVGMQRFSTQIWSGTPQKAGIGIAIIGILLLQVEWYYPIYKNMLYECMQPIFIICLLIWMFQQRKSYRFFTWIGAYAYTIYLFHGFGTAGGRIILNRLGIHSEILIFLVALSVSVFLPIILDQILQKWKITRFLFLGKKQEHEIG